MTDAWVVVDLGFGDAGKGTVTDFLVRDRGAELVVRFSGGAQAGHNVVTPDGRHHTFSQLGAGTFAGARTVLLADVVVHPLALWFEAAHLAEVGVPDALGLLSVDRRARVITPFQQAAGRLRELSRPVPHGTTGVGVGEAVADALAGHDDVLTMGDLTDVPRLRRRLGRQRARKLAEAREVDDPRAEAELGLLRDPGAIDAIVGAWAEVTARVRIVEPDVAARQVRRARRVVCEGAQGVLLDEDWGFHPHTTWSDCTPRGALEVLGDREATVLGVSRAYTVRHGPGPFPTATPGFLAGAEAHNDDAGWQGAFRAGPLDLVLLRYAVEVAGRVDALALTCLDQVPPPTPVVRRYAELSRLEAGAIGDLGHRQALGERLRRVRPRVERVEDVVEAVEVALGRRVVLTSAGPTAAGKRWM